MASKAEIHTLHRYFLYADRMRRHFDQEAARFEATAREWDEAVIPWIYLVLWYGCLRVVIEGWTDLGLSDPGVDSLMDANKVKVLNGVRNDTFHFQRACFPSRTTRMLADEGFIEWVRSIHQAIGDVLLRMLGFSRWTSQTD